MPHGYRHISDRLTVRLDTLEQFDREVRFGRIRVDRVTFDNNYREGERMHVAIRGIAIKNDGSLGSINRSGDMPLSELPREVLEEAIRTLRSGS